MKSVKFQPKSKQNRKYLKHLPKLSESQLSKCPQIKQVNQNTKRQNQKPSPSKVSKSILKNCCLPYHQQKYIKMLQLRQAIKDQYKNLLSIYETNEQKLRRITSNQLNINNNYIYSKQITIFVKTGEIKLIKDLNSDLFSQDLAKYHQFLKTYNTKKKIRQVQILKQSMLSRQSLIRQSSSNEQYQQIYKHMRVPLKGSGYTIYDQFKCIRADFNLPQNPNDTHEMLYNKMDDAEICINQVMRTEAGKREKLRLRILGLNLEGQL